MIVETGSGAHKFESHMSYRSLAFAITAFSSVTLAAADAQSVYVAPGGVYIGAGPVYVIPAPNNAAPYVASSHHFRLCLK